MNSEAKNIAQYFHTIVVCPPLNGVTITEITENKTKQKVNKVNPTTAKATR